jgi:hypothetical protein
MKLSLISICAVALLYGCTAREAAGPVTSEPLPSDIVAAAKRYASHDSRTADLRAKYPDILDQRTTQGVETQQGSKYYFVEFRKDNPRGAASFLVVQINLDMTLRGFKEYKKGF